MTEVMVAAAEAFDRRTWAEVHSLLSGAPADRCAPADLERLAVASYLTGRDREALEAWEAAHKKHLESGNRAEAARCGFWVAFCSMMQGQMSHAGGWLSRTKGVIGDDLDCPAAGYLLIPATLQALDAGEAAVAVGLAVEAGEIASRFGDPDLAAFSTLGHGQALLVAGDAPAGLARLDEVMVSVSAGEVGPIVTGIVYCAVVLECMQLFDLARGAEWTARLDKWCRSQPDLVPYRGQCLVHQSQLHTGGRRLGASGVDGRIGVRPPHRSAPPSPRARPLPGGRTEPAAGRAERRRRRLPAGKCGRLPTDARPGPPRTGGGDARAAAASIRRALGEAPLAFQRPGLLAAAVEISLATGDDDGARHAADELAEIAEQSHSAILTALAEQAGGAVLLEGGQAADALVHLRAACGEWRRLRMPYEAARTSVLLGQACLALGDRASALLEFDAARDAFAQLGAEIELARLRSVTGDPAGRGVLSAREVEVLGHVAAGLTNREIASTLSISEHTVGRHLENIFTKLGVSGRAAATAYAYEHELFG